MHVTAVHTREGGKAPLSCSSGHRGLVHLEESIGSKWPWLMASRASAPDRLSGGCVSVHRLSQVTAAVTVASTGEGLARGARHWMARLVAVLTNTGFA
jgi:hypothetical protein